MKRVVITGMGIYSCIGKNLDEVKDSLYNGKSGIGIDPVRKELGYFSALTGILERPDLKKLLDRRKRLCLPEQGEYAYLATLEAFRNAGIDDAFLEANEVGILYGNDSSAAPVINAVDIIREKKNTALVGSGSIFQSMNSTVTMNLSVIFKLRGVNFTIAGACASGSHAIGMGYLLIKSGLQDCILCGGAQEVNPYAVGSFDGLGAFSKRESDPAAASRPFDKDRDGFVIGEGAGALILEEYEHAKARGAKIYCEVVGGGASADAYHFTAPHPEGKGAMKAMRDAIKDAGIAPEDIDYVNVHGTSTPAGDIPELKAVAGVLGDHVYNVNISSTKSMTGHLLGAAGAVEALACIFALTHGVVPPTINCENRDPEIDEKLNLTLNVAQKRDVKCALSNTFGFGGHNSTVIFRKL